MCCYATVKKTDALREKIKANGGKMSFWKLIRVEGNTSYVKRTYVWKKGVHVGVPDCGRDKYSVYTNKREKDLYYGIHVYVDKEEAEARRNWACGPLGYPVALIEVECDEKDLLGCDAYTVVFSKVTVTPRMWKSYLERKRKVLGKVKSYIESKRK